MSFCLIPWLNKWDFPHIRFEEKLILLSLYNNPSKKKILQRKKFLGGHTPTSLIPTKLDFLQQVPNTKFPKIFYICGGKVDVINIFMSSSSSYFKSI